MRHVDSLQDKAMLHDVRSLGHGHYVVTSGESRKEYGVRALDEGGATCTCDWGKYRKYEEPSACSHVIAVVMFKAAAKGLRCIFCASLEIAQMMSGEVDELGDDVWIAYRRVG